MIGSSGIRPLLARSLRWSHQVPGRGEAPVAAFTRAGRAWRVPHQAGITGQGARMPRKHLPAVLSPGWSRRGAV
jgi:hypothetical protein